MFKVDGEEIDPVEGISIEGGNLKVRMNGFYARAETNFGLALEHDGYWTALVKMPGSFRDMTDGLCGKNDGDLRSDLITKGGLDVAGELNSHSLLGNSWQVLDPEDPR